MKKSTLIVVLLALALGGAVWYFEFKREKPAEDAASASKPLFEFKQEDVTGITLARAGETCAFEKREKDWRITKPLDAAADSSAVDSLLSSLAYGRISRTIMLSPPVSPEKLKEFGLDKPAVTLEIKLKSGASRRLRLGAKDFSGNSVYALADNAADVALLSDDVLTSSDKPLLDFRDRRIAVFDRENIARFRVKNQHVTLLGEKKDDKWLVVEPAKFKGRELEASRILDALENARATEILDSPKPADRARLARPAVEVQLIDKDSKIIDVVLSPGKEKEKEKEGVLVRSSFGAMLFKIPQYTFDSLNSKPDDLIKKEEPKEAEAKQEAPKKDEPKNPPSGKAPPKGQPPPKGKKP